MKNKSNLKQNVIINYIRRFTEDEIEKTTTIQSEFNKSTSNEQRNLSVSYISLFRYTTVFDKILIFFAVLCCVISGLMVPVNINLFSNLAGIFINTTSKLIHLNGSEFDHEANNLSTFVSHYAIMNSWLGLSIFTFSYLAIIIFNYTAFKQIFYIRQQFFASILNQDIAWYDANTTENFASRMAEDLIKLEDGIGEKLAIFLHSFTSFSALFVWILVIGWKLAIVCLPILPIAMITITIISKISLKFSRAEATVYETAGAIAEEVFSSIRTIVAFGGEDIEVKRYNEKLTDACKINVKKSFYYAIGFGIFWCFIYSNYALTFWYGVVLVLEDKYKPEAQIVYRAATVITVYYAVLQAISEFNLIAPLIDTFTSAMSCGGKFFNVISNLPTINAFKNKGHLLENIKGKIEFKDVCFQYPSRPQVPVLQDFNLTINPGETVALVGSSGCGKSTCIQLMQRFYDTINGKIYIDDNSIDELNLSWLRNNIGVVGQEPILFGTTIAENIKFGSYEASEKDIEQAAKEANAHDFIKNLPLGYDTLVGERGAQLSGGQKQRIAIARALIRDPAILLLDEATSALDTNSEATVQAALDKASKKRTTIIVAHRLSTIKNADKIAVLSNGKVVEQGKHNELMALQGAYYQLVTTQVAVNYSVETTEKNYHKNGLSKTNGNISNTENTIDNYVQTTEINNRVKISKASFWKLIKENSPEWPYITVGCLASIIIGCVIPAYTILYGEFIGTLGREDDAIVKKNSNTISLCMVFLGIVNGISVFLQSWCFGISSAKLTNRLRSKMFKAMLQQEIGWYDNKNNGTGSLCSRLSSNATEIQGATGLRIALILQSIITISLALTIGLYYDYRLALVAFCFTPFILFVYYLRSILLNKDTTKHQSQIEEANSLAVEAVTNIRTVASLGCEEIFQNIYTSKLIPGYQSSKTNIHCRGIIMGLWRSAIYFAFTACTYYGSKLIIHDNLPYSSVVKITQSAILGTITIGSALVYVPNFQKGLEAATKIFEILNRKPLIVDIPTAKDIEWKNTTVYYNNTHFAYPTRPEVKVLQDLNLAIFHGKTVALVGPSGCGKSTIVQILQRFYNLTAGNIKIDDENIEEIKLTKLRSQIGIVFQEPILFDRTIAENIAYGDNSRIVTDVDIIAAAKEANIHNFIISLPMGYATKLGKKGMQLSGGQKQRIAIARALVRNPKILILDEATSALDTDSEKAVQAALMQAKKGRTCITIAHRLSTIHEADLICVINKGKILEIGSHGELLRLKGLYYHLNTLQTI